MILADAAAAVPPDALNDSIKALTDAFASHNIALAVVAAVIVLGCIALKALGKDIPLVTPIAEFALDLAKKLSAKPADPSKQPGVAAAVNVTVEKTETVTVTTDKPSSNVIDIKKDV